MAYIAPKDFSLDSNLLAKLTKVFSGDLDLSWMKQIPERIAVAPSQPGRGLTLDDINVGSYAPERSPEIVRHNFSMAPRGALLPQGLPSLGYRLNRKSEVWSDSAAEIFEEGKSRRWAPAQDVPWAVLDAADLSDTEDAAWRQIATGLVSIGLVAGDVAAHWEWQMNQEFHEVKYVMCLQMIDAARISEAFRKRALYGQGRMGTDYRELGELLKMVFESGTYPSASASMNLVLFSWVQGIGRHLEWAATNPADRQLGTRLTQDASRFVAYGVSHLRYLLGARPNEAEALNAHLDLVENGVVGWLAAREWIEPLVVLSDGLDPVASFYRRCHDEVLARCRAAGLGDRRARSPLVHFLDMLAADGDTGRPA
ncbi:MAG: hypothetical protein ACE5FL_03715 [Myxococcota bacterium]